MTDEDYAAIGLLAPSSRVDPPGMPRDVASLIDRATSICPDREALDDGKSHYSFRQLAETVAAATSMLAFAGVRSGARFWSLESC